LTTHIRLLASTSAAQQFPIPGSLMKVIYSLINVKFSTLSKKCMALLVASKVDFSIASVQHGVTDQPKKNLLPPARHETYNLPKQGLPILVLKFILSSTDTAIIDKFVMNIFHWLHASGK
jgi:hypothetical protein